MDHTIRSWLVENAIAHLERGDAWTLLGALNQTFIDDFPQYADEYREIVKTDLSTWNNARPCPFHDRTEAEEPHYQPFIITDEMRAEAAQLAELYDPPDDD